MDPTSVKLLSLLGPQILPLTNAHDSGFGYHHEEEIEESISPTVSQHQKYNTIAGIQVVNDSPVSVVREKICVLARHKVPQRSISPIGTQNMEGNIPGNVQTVNDSPVSAVVNEKIRVPAKRKAPPGVSKVGDISGYVPAKKLCMEDRSQTEDELANLKRDSYIRQNKVLDVQLETAELHAAETELAIKQAQLKYEEIRLQEISTTVYNHANL